MKMVLRSGSTRNSSLTLVLLWIVLCLCVTVSDGYVKYNTGAGVVPDKLNVHLVAHSHDDVGWLKTVDQYYIGLNKWIQDACVENVLDSVIAALRRDPNRRFVFAEMAFFHLWWVDQNPEMQELVRKLVDAGQLEFVNGGWCMHDEAATHYIDMIDHTTLGHGLIKRLFNTTPRAGWQVDPFGHSAVQAYLLGAEVGFDSVHFARIDYQDREERKKLKSLEVIWRGSKTFGSSSQIFTNVFPDHYYPPEGFRFELTADFTHFQDNPLLEAYNVEQRVDDFVQAAQSQGSVTRDNHIMWTMGGDFDYQYAESWFKQMDKLIHHVNEDGRVNALYSTPSIYTDAKNAGNTSWPLKTDDYFPYADRVNAYWTGYFTSRPGLKGYIRMLSGYYLAARQLEFLAGKTLKGPVATYDLGDALGIAQHHDAVSGTAKQHTTDDYAKRLAIGAHKAEAVVSSALSCLTDKSEDQCATTSTFSQCPLLNISYCPPTEEDITEGKNLVIVAYNPLGWSRTDVIRIPVNDSNLLVQDSSGYTVEAQYVPLDDVTKNVREFYTEAYLGHPPKIVPQYWLVFQVTVPPLGWNTYFISKAAGTDNYVEENRYRSLSAINLPKNENIEVGPGNLKMSFSSTTGQLHRMYNSRTGVDIPMQQNFLFYNSYDSYYDASGAYLFRPDGSPTKVSQSKPVEVIRGALVDEVHQQFDTWIYQVTRLYKDREHAEVEYTIGPIPDGDRGKEVISRITTNLTTEKVFYTDSNGRDFLKRIRDYRADWNYQINQPEAGNYYPLNLGMFITDKSSEFSILVDRAIGGSSLKDGEVEIMLHRRMFYDDGRGVEEALNEKVWVKDTYQALTVRGKYHLSINKLGNGAHWRRTTGQEVYSPLLLAFTYEDSETWKASHTTKATTMDPNYTLPTNVALITLQVLDDGSVLVRLAHLYEVNEDSEYSTLAKVELKKIFYGKTIKEVKEMSLSANQQKSEMKKLNWKVEGDNGSTPGPVKGGPVDDSTLVVELGPMEIRTFLLKF